MKDLKNIKEAIVFHGMHSAYVRQILRIELLQMTAIN